MIVNNNFKLKIGGAVYTNYISYPLTIKSKSLNDAFDEYQIPLSNVFLEKPLTNNQRVELQVYDGDNLEKTFYGVLLSDTSEKMGVLDLYKHNIVAAEYLYYTTLFVAPDMTFTRFENEPGFSFTVADAYDRVIKLTRDEYPYFNIFSLDQRTRDLLDSKQCYEMTFRGQTVFEIIETLFNILEVRPKFASFDVLTSFGVSQEQEDLHKYNKFTGMVESYNPAAHSAGIVSDVKNILLPSVKEPGIGWTTPRSDTGSEISEDNNYIPTKYNIESIKDIRVKFRLWYYGLESSLIPNHYAGIIPEAMTADILNDSLIFDHGVLRNFLYEKNAYINLPKTPEGMGSAIYFETGKRNIQGLSYRPDSWSSWFPFGQAIKRILNLNFMQWRSMSDPSFKHFKTLEDQTNIRNYAMSQLPSGRSWTRLEFILVPYETNKVTDDTLWGTGPKLDEVQLSNREDYKIRNLQFQVEYNPYHDTKVYAFREQNTQPGLVSTVAPYNQNSNNTSNLQYGELIDKVVKANSGFDRTIKFFHTDKSQELQEGKRIGNWIITGYQKQYHKTYIDAVYTFDEYFTKINQYTLLREKWRQFAIPTENILTRQITFNRFAKFSSERRNPYSDIIAARFLYLKKIESLFFRVENNDAMVSVMLPALAYPFNNALIFEGETEENNNIGNQASTFDNNKKFSNPISNVNWDTITDIQFSAKNYRAYDVTKSDKLPIVEGMNPDYNAANIFHNYLSKFDKDAREKLKFSLQMHFVDTTSKIFINESLTRQNALVGGPGYDNLKVVFLAAKPYNYRHLKQDEIIFSSPASFNYSAGSITLPVRLNSTGTTSIATAIANQENEILYWVDELTIGGMSSRQYYINFDNIYKEEDTLQTYEWVRETDHVPQFFDYDVEYFYELPDPRSSGLTARVGRSEWVPTSKKPLTSGYIEPVKLTNGPVGTVGAITGYNLIEEDSVYFNSTRERAWKRTTPKATVNFTAKYLEDLPPAPNTISYAKVERNNWAEVFIEPTNNIFFGSKLNDIPITSDATKKVIITNFDLVPSNYDEYTEGGVWHWKPETSVGGSYTHDVRYFEQLPAASGLNQSARVSNLEWIESNFYQKADNGNIIFSADELPLNLITSGNKYTVVGFDLTPSNSTEFEEGFELRWKEHGTTIGSPIHNVNRLTDLPAPGSLIETAKVHNLTWNPRAATSSITNNYYKTTLDEIIGMGLGDDTPKTAVATKFDLSPANFSDWSENVSYIWLASGVGAPFNYTVKHFSQLPSPGSIGLRARVYRNNLTSVTFDSNKAASGYIASTEDKLRVYTGGGTQYGIITGYDLVQDSTGSVLFTLTGSDGFNDVDVWNSFYSQQKQYFGDMSLIASGNYLFRYDDGFGYTYYRLVRNSSPQEISMFLLGNVVDTKYESVSQSNNFNLSLTGPDGFDEQDVWRSFHTQHTTLFNNMSLLAANNGVLRYDDGYGYTYYKVQLRSGQNASISYYNGTKDIKYYTPERVMTGLRITLTVPEGFDNYDIWESFQNQETQLFGDLDLAYYNNLVIRLDDGFGNTYLKLSSVSGQPNKYFTSNTDVRYYITQFLISSDNLQLNVPDNHNEADVWLSMKNQESQAFDNLLGLYNSNSIIRCDDGFGYTYYRVEPTQGAATTDLQYYDFESHIIFYYSSEWAWSGVRLFLTAPELANMHDYWYAFYNQETQYFEDMDQTYYNNGRLRYDDGFGYKYFRLEPVDGNASLQYYEVTEEVLEYYLSKVQI